MRRITGVAVGGMLALSLACGPTASPPPAPAPAPEPERDRDRGGKGRKAGEDRGEEVVDRWTPFLKQRFGAEPRGSWRLDFDADGRDEIAIRIAKQLIVAPVGPGPEPSTWDALEVPVERTEISVRERAWAVDAIPALADHVPARGSVLRIGDGEAPIVVFRDRAADAYAWSQVVPSSLATFAEAARKEHPDAFAIGKNNLLGKKGTEGEDPLSQAFVGDFDGDDALELLVIDGARTWRWTPGSDKPRFETIDYPARKGMLSTARGRVDAPHEKQPVELDRDAVELWIPETSSALFVWRDDRWQKIQLGD